MANARLLNLAFTLPTCRDDEERSRLVEYTVLLGILLVAVIATIVAVGTWVNGEWTALISSPCLRELTKLDQRLSWAFTEGKAEA